MYRWILNDLVWILVHGARRYLIVVLAARFLGRVETTVQQLCLIYDVVTVEYVSVIKSMYIRVG
jgi:hypothetical protein